MNSRDTTVIAHLSHVEDIPGNMVALFYPCFIHRLPTEILEPIFIRTAHDYFRTTSGRPILTAPSWVNVSHVNRHWRNVALNCPTLWTFLFVTSPRWTEELLVRSKQEPLKLSINLRKWDEKHLGLHFLDQVMVHSERIEELRLHIPIGDYVLLSRLSSAAPRLQHLEISADPYHRVWSSIPFDGDTPVLRTLRLTGCPVPWRSLQLSGLTTLALHELPDQFQLNVTDFLTTLDRMQDLRYLYLDRALTRSAAFLSSDEFDNFPKISLPHISQLSLFAPLSTVITLLSCLHIPLETEVRLGPDYRLQNNVVSINDYNPLCSLLADRYSTVFGPAIRAWVIEYSDSPYICTKLVFYTPEHDGDPSPSVSCQEQDGTIPLQIFLTFDPSTILSDWHRLISRVCHSMPLSTVRSLHVSHPPLSQAFWVDILEKLQGLQYIRLSYGAMPDLASVLSCTPNYETLFHNSISAPALERLDLHNISFSSEQQSYNTDEVEGIGIQSLSNALSTRKQHPGRLTMTQCIERLPASDVSFKTFDMEGLWEGGRFSIINDKGEYDEESNEALTIPDTTL